MSKLFLHLLNISITAGWIVLVVVLLRFVLKKAPKWTRVVLWGLVALRLLLPVSIESVTSLVPSAETVKVESVTAPVLTSVNEYNGVSYFYENVRGEQIVLQSGFPTLNSAINPTPEKAAEHFDTVAVLKSVAGWVWLAGVVGMLFYALISFLRLCHRVRASVLLEKGVYVCDEIKDPFILGLIVPKIYLPSGMDEQTRAYVLAHERAHLKRFDHIWKPLGFLLLSVYWFNPLLWLAYILLCRDIELACDEKVVKELDDAGKAAYSEALVTASVSRRSIAACPLAFGETGVKSRVKSVLNYKKPAFWIILVAILACIAVAICFLTMPKKNQPDAAEIVGTWEFYKQIVDTYETDWPIEEMLGTRRDVLIFRENGTGTELYIRDDVTRENPFTYTVSGNKVLITRNGRDRVPVEFTYDPESSMLRSPEDAGEGLLWYTLYVREGSISYPTVQLTNEQIAGEWKTDGLSVMEGMPLTLSGDLVFDANGTAALHLNGDNHTEMTVNGTYDTEGSVIRFEPEDDTAVLEYYPWFDQSMLFHLSIKDFKPEYQNTALASYDPQTDTIRFVVLHFGVLTFHRSIPATAMPVVQWLDYYNDFEGFSWDSSKEITVAAFPGVTFRWTAGSVEAVENGKTRTLFAGMPVWSVYFTDLTGDGKPDLCATVSFGSGIVDEHIIVYDYVNKQSYVLWDRMQFDFHLYTVDGALYVGKTPYMGDKQVDYGTLTMHAGVLSCRWQSDSSFAPLLRELHESDLYGEWLVEEERDANGNVLYTFPQNDLWKEYNFREDGTVVYNETVPISSDSEKAFGHPVEYSYTVHDGHVHIEDDRSCWGYYDPRTRTLELSYQTSPGQYTNATLRRMGEDAQSETTLDEATLCTTWMLAEIEAADGSNGDARALGLEQYLVFRSDGTVRMIDTKKHSDQTVPYTLSGNTVRFGDRTLRYDPALNELFGIDPSSQNVLSYTPAPNASPAYIDELSFISNYWVYAVSTEFIETGSEFGYLQEPINVRRYRDTDGSRLVYELNGMTYKEIVNPDPNGIAYYEYYLWFYDRSFFSFYAQTNIGTLYRNNVVDTLEVLILKDEKGIEHILAAEHSNLLDISKYDAKDFGLLAFSDDTIYQASQFSWILDIHTGRSIENVAKAEEFHEIYAITTIHLTWQYIRIPGLRYYFLITTDWITKENYIYSRAERCIYKLLSPLTINE